MNAGSPGDESRQPRRPWRILCIGDSITQGGRVDRDEFTYRLPLQESLIDRGIPFACVGSQTEGVDPGALWPDPRGRPFDPAHEGYYGAPTAWVAHRVAAHLEAFPPPDLALIHLGTNDQSAPDPAAAVRDPLARLIDRLRERNPSIAILLGHLNFAAGPALPIRGLVNALAARTTRPESPVLTVPHYQGWRAHPEDPRSDTFDWVHPNPRGQRKMADAWMGAIGAALPNCRLP